jgi:hypothetical protein
VRRSRVASVEGTLETMPKKFLGFHGVSVLRSPPDRLTCIAYAGPVRVPQESTVDRRISMV